MGELNDRENWIEKAGETTGFFIEYINQQKELLTLEWSGKVSKLVGFSLLLIVVLGLSGLILLFLGFACAHYLQEIGYSASRSYLLVAGGAFLLFLLIWLLRRYILFNPVLRIFLGIIYDEEKEH
jgi:hypothetical protein